MVESRKGLPEKLRVARETRCGQAFARSLVGIFELLISQADSPFIARRIEELGTADFATVIGGVSLDEMSTAYGGANLFVFASSCEVSPNTLVEVMTAGLLEQADVALDVHKRLREPDLRLRCAKKAYGYVGEYTYKGTAWQTYDFMRTVSRSYR